MLATDRANEKAHQHLMFCLAAQGDRIAALKQYDECKKILHGELNAEPSSETTALRDQRAGKFLTKTDRKSCIAAERSGLDKQLEFQQDALSVELGNDAASVQTYRARLVQNVRAEAAALQSRNLWDQYCGAFEG